MNRHGALAQHESDKGRIACQPQVARAGQLPASFPVMEEGEHGRGLKVRASTVRGAMERCARKDRKRRNVSGSHYGCGLSCAATQVVGEETLHEVREFVRVHDVVVEPAETLARLP